MSLEHELSFAEANLPKATEMRHNNEEDSRDRISAEGRERNSLHVGNESSTQEEKEKDSKKKTRGILKNKTRTVFHAGWASLSHNAFADESSIALPPPRKKQRAKDTFLSESELSNYDVRCLTPASGKGLLPDEGSVGSNRFRVLLKLQKDRYVLADKEEKFEIVLEILRSMRKTNPPSRFVASDAETGMWKVLEQSKAFSATAKTFKDIHHKELIQKKRSAIENSDKKSVH
jgi:hypothetical protein